MRRIYISVKEDAFRALQRRALDERRDVRAQAAVELERVLRPAPPDPHAAAESTRGPLAPAAAGATP